MGHVHFCVWGGSFSGQERRPAQTARTTPQQQSGNPSPAWETSCGCCAATRRVHASSTAARRGVVPCVVLGELQKSSENAVVEAGVVANRRGFLPVWQPADQFLLYVCHQGACGAAKGGAGTRQAISKEEIDFLREFVVAHFGRVLRPGRRAPRATEEGPNYIAGTPVAARARAVGLARGRPASVDRVHASTRTNDVRGRLGAPRAT